MGPLADPSSYITSFYEIWPRQAAALKAITPTGPIMTGCGPSGCTGSTGCSGCPGPFPPNCGSTGCGSGCGSHTCPCPSCDGSHHCSCGHCGSCGSCGFPCSGCQQGNCGQHGCSSCCNPFGNKNEETTLDGFGQTEESAPSPTASTAQDPSSQPNQEPPKAKLTYVAYNFLFV